MCVSHFPHFQLSCHILGPTVCIYHFSCFSIFRVTFLYLKSVILIFCDFQFSCHIPGPTVCNSHFSRFSVIWSFFNSSSVCFSFSMIFSFLAIFQVLQCAFLIFHVFQWFHHFSSPQVCVSHFPRFPVFLPYSMSSSGHFSFLRIFSFPCHISQPTVYVSHLPHFHLSCHIPGPTGCIYHFSCFSIFLVIFHYLKSVILIFRVFQFAHHIPGRTVCISHFSRISVISSFFKSSSVCFSFSMIFSFLTILQVLQWYFQNSIFLSHQYRKFATKTVSDYFYFL